MNIILDVDVLSGHQETEAPMKVSIRSRRYNIVNNADLKTALDNTPKDIALQNENENAQGQVSK